MFGLYVGAPGVGELALVVVSDRKSPAGGVPGTAFSSSRGAAASLMLKISQGNWTKRSMKGQIITKYTMCILTAKRSRFKPDDLRKKKRRSTNGSRNRVGGDSLQ